MTGHEEQGGIEERKGDDNAEKKSHARLDGL